MGETTVSLVGIEAEERAFVSAGGVSQDPLMLFPCREDGSGFEALAAPVLPLPAQLWTLSLQPSLGRLGKLSGLLLSWFFSHLMHRITLMGLNSSSQATRGKNNKLLNVRQNYGPLLFRVSLVDLGPLCSIVLAALSIGAGETQVGNFIAERVQGKAGSERFRSETAAVGERGLFLLESW